MTDTAAKRSQRRAASRTASRLTLLSLCASSCSCAQSAARCRIAGAAAAAGLRQPRTEREASNAVMRSDLIRHHRFSLDRRVQPTSADYREACSQFQLSLLAAAVKPRQPRLRYGRPGTDKRRHWRLASVRVCGARATLLTTSGSSVGWLSEQRLLVTTRAHTLRAMSRAAGCTATT